jgi:DNA modification methylase
MHDIIQGNCLEVLTQLEDNSIDAIVTDPPYELGFMGKSWDNTGIANNPLMWAECLRVLKPGGHLLAFSGTRTYHRMAVAIEDAGFEVRDMIEWIYSTGFPKSLNIGKAVDKLQGNEREIVGEQKLMGTARRMKGGNFNDFGGEDTADVVSLTKGTSEWEGWGTALKPAHEPICMARKPLAEKTVAENCLKYGTGGINIDESRVGYSSEYDKKHQDDIQKGQLNADNGKFFGGNGQSISSGNLQGRFPANLIHDNSEEVRECFPESKSGAMNGIYKNTMMKGEPGVRDGKEIYLHQEASSGNASRFFKSIIYQAKASKSERNKGCEELEEKERIDYGGFHSEQGLINNNRNPENRKPTTNNHPTVKPIALMEYLIKMVTPKGGIVLDPFAGSGSTLVAAKQNGFQYVGIELDKDYCIIAESRLKQKTLKQEVLF